MTAVLRSEDGVEVAAVEFRRDGPVLVVALNRPAKRNAVDFAVASGVAAALDILDADSSLRVAVLTGNGGTFCAGMDLGAFSSGELPSVPGRGFAGIVESPPDKPIIAAVEGWALGGGFEIALACDLITAGRGARFGLPEVKRGLVASGGGAFLLPLRIPYGVAMELILTGDDFTADRAFELGLINRLCEDGSALSDALELAHRIAENAPLSVRASKRVARDSADWAADERFARQSDFFDAVFASQDATEGVAAFRERRAPVWSDC